MNAAVRTMLLCGFRFGHPEVPAETIDRRLAGLLLGDGLAQRVYGPLVVSGDAG